ncbi:MAG: hypothetical protein DMG92_09180 [Acidobacteria bacterium]|nr:MAG: hypothetical protein DMG92_09180 [Acidobacteriota bacterium]
MSIEGGCQRKRGLRLSIITASVTAGLRTPGQESTLASTSTQSDFVTMIAQEVVSGIDEAVGYWLGRIEQELAGRGVSAEQQLRNVQEVIREYKEVTGKLPFRCARA